MSLSPGSPKRPLTDAALSQLALSRRQSLSYPPAAVRGRIGTRGSPLGTVDPQGIYREGTLVRLVSIAEAYTDALMFELVYGKLGSPTALLEVMLEEAQIAASSSWARREEAFKNWHGISLKTMAKWPELDAAIDVRNAIAHGLGRLTPVLRKRRGLAQKVQKIEVSVGADRFRTTDRTLQITFEACAAYVRSLDAAV